MEGGLVQGTIPSTDLAFEVAEQVDPTTLLAAELAKRGDGVDTDTEYGGPGTPELRKLVGKPAEFRRADPRERQGEEGEEYVRAVSELGEGDVAASGGRQREVRCRPAHRWQHGIGVVHHATSTSWQ